MPICSAPIRSRSQSSFTAPPRSRVCPICSPRCEPGERAPRLGERHHLIHHRPQPALRGRAARSPRTPGGCPCVEPRMLHWCQKSRAQVELRPSDRWWRRRSRAGRRAAARGATRSQVASRPTLSTTTSAPRPPVQPARPRRRRRRVPWFSVDVGAECRGPPRAWRRSRWSRSTRAPSSRAIWSAASATPPPMPQISTVSPGCERGPRDEHPPRRERRERERGGLRPRHLRRAPAPGSRAGTTTNSAAVPGRCSPSTRKVEQSDSSPARQAAQCAAGDAGIDHHPVARRERPVTSRPDRLDDCRRRPSRRRAGRCSSTPGRPSATKRSSRLSAAARIRTSTSPAGLELRARHLLQREVVEPADAVRVSAFMAGAPSERRAQHLLAGAERHERPASARPTSGWMRSESCDLPLAASATLPGDVGDALAVPARRRATRSAGRSRARGAAPSRSRPRDA